jgi:predicted Zn-dependent protease
MIARLPAIALAACLTVLAACTQNAATGRSSFTGFMNADDEAKIGRDEGSKAVKQYGGVYAEKDLPAYIQRLGESLARVTEIPDQKFTFTLLNTDMVNAFALPGGYVYVTRGIMALAENEAELAGVMAHEIGHVVARHSAQRYSTAMGINYGIGIASIVGQMFGLPAGLGDVASQGAQMYLMSYSRDQELEADMLGIRYMSKAGYDPNGMVTFFQKLEAYTKLEAKMEGRKEPNGPDMMATHPQTPERIAKAMDLSQKIHLDNPRVDREGYLDHIDGLLFGDDPKQGVVKGRTFVHPDLRVQFTVPGGFTLFNSDNSVVAKGPNGAAIVFDVAHGARGVRTVDYLTGTWARGARLSNLETIDINGLETATGTLRGSRGNTTVDLRLLAIRDDGDSVFRLMFITPPSLTASLQAELERTTFSFRRLSESEARAVQPLRVHVLRAQPGPSLDGAIEKMPFETYSRQWFEVLNGLAPGETVPAGERVKVVTE